MAETPTPVRPAPPPADSFAERCCDRCGHRQLVVFVGLSFLCKSCLESLAALFDREIYRRHAT